MNPLTGDTARSSCHSVLNPFLLRATVAFQQRYDQPPSPPIYTDKSEELYRGRLTYCTWNSLQDPVPRTATAMMRTLESFPVVPNNLLIDDGWQTTMGDRQMAGYGAQDYWLDGYKSLGDVISKAKKIGVERVGVWHTVLGYWGGISDRAKRSNMSPFSTLRKNWGATYPIIHPLQVDRFFDTWYKQLSDWGVDFVKCDDMAEIEDMDSCSDDNGTSFPLRTVRTAYVTAIKRNVQRYFGGRIIWYTSPLSLTYIRCMSQSPRHLLGHTHCRRLKTSNLCDRVTITFPISPHLMPITSTPIPLSRNSNPAFPLPISICFKLINFWDHCQPSPHRAPSMRLYGRWGMDL